MTLQDLMGEIEQLPLSEQLLLLETLSRSIRQTLDSHAHRNWRGVLASDAPPPTDEEIKEIYVDYLEAKYR